MHHFLSLMHLNIINLLTEHLYELSIRKKYLFYFTNLVVWERQYAVFFWWSDFTEWFHIISKWSYFIPKGSETILIYNNLKSQNCSGKLICHASEFPLWLCIILSVQQVFSYHTSPNKCITDQQLWSLNQTFCNKLIAKYYPK